MLNTALAQELMGLGVSFGKTWCYPTQQTILARLKEHHGQTLSLRTLNRHLASLEAAGWIRRTARHQHHKTLGWVFRSTLYVTLAPVWKALKSLAKSVRHAARWSRVPNVANNVVPTVLKSSPAAPTGPPGDSKKVSERNFLSESRKLLAR